MTASFFPDDSVPQHPQATRVSQSINPREHCTASVADRMFVGFHFFDKTTFLVLGCSFTVH